MAKRVTGDPFQVAARRDRSLPDLPLINPEAPRRRKEGPEP